MPPVPCRYLQNNQLSGTIPNSLGKLNQLTLLYVIGVVAVWLGLRSVRVRVRVGGRAAIGLGTELVGEGLEGLRFWVGVQVQGYG